MNGPCSRHGWQGSGPCLDCDIAVVALRAARKALRRDILRGLLSNPEVFRGLSSEQTETSKTMDDLVLIMHRVTRALEPMLQEEVG
jgi:hypothetical protein